MRPGTTPKHTFTLPFDTSLIKTVQVTYKQGDKIVLKKKTEACTLDGATISYRLTQEETFLFDQETTVRIQVRVLTHDGQAPASDVMYRSPQECLDDEVLT